MHQEPIRLEVGEFVVSMNRARRAAVWLGGKLSLPRSDWTPADRADAPYTWEGDQA